MKTAKEIMDLFDPDHEIRERDRLTNIVYMMLDLMKKKDYEGWHMNWWGTDCICIDNRIYQGIFIPAEEYEYVRELCDYPGFECNIVPWNDGTIVIKISIKKL